MTACLAVAGCSDGDDVPTATAPLPATPAPPETHPAPPDTTSTSPDPAVPATDDADTDAGPDPDTGVGSDRHPVCEPLAEVIELSALVDAEFAPLATLSPDASSEAEVLEVMTDVADVLDEQSSQVFDAYDRAIDVAPPELVNDLETLAAGTADLLPPLVDGLRAAEGFDDVQAAFAALAEPPLADAAMEAARAAFELDEFTIPECGFQLSDS